TEEAAAVDPVASFVAAADAAAGQAIVEAQCAACHSFEDGGDTRVGPNLYGIIGDAQAAREFAYSDALSGLGGTWSYEAMDGFLENPMDYASGTKMGFGGLASQEDRANVIAYLRSNDSEPESLPEP
ncbi:MAG: c-type cytochrome, partial [Alphaproteobacteria bacterium]|nr:c-type cytochrome [Alphaproteobacteria bacterium]